MSGPKHVVWFLCDQLRWDCLGFTGSGYARTPNLDRLAASGVIFDNMFVQYPTCMASRSSMLTGRYPQVTRMSGGSPLLDPRETTVPEVLQRAGWRTGMFGKLHVTPQQYTAGQLKSNRPIADWHAFMDDFGLWPIAEDRAKQNYGFQEVVPFEDILWGAYIEDWLPKKDKRLAELFAAEGRMGSSVWRSQAPGTFLGDAGTRPIPAELHPSMFIAESAVDFFERHHDDAPCYMHVSFVDPHHPFDPPDEVMDTYSLDDVPMPRYNDTGDVRLPPVVANYMERATGPAEEVTEQRVRFTIAAYYAMIEMIDRAVGRVVQAVEDAGEMDNTLFVFVADHGEFIGEYGLWRKPTLHYDTLIRVPCFVSAPGSVDGGRRFDGLAEQVDLPATVLDLLGEELPTGMQGRPLTEVLSGDADTWKDSIFCQSARAEQSGPYCNCATVRTTRGMLSFYPDDNGWVMFDLENDPHERVDVYDDPAHRPLRDELTTLMVNRLLMQRDPLPLKFTQY